MTRYACCHARRLQSVADAGVLNGIRHLDVRDRDEPVHALRQRTLFVRLLLPPAGLTGDNVQIDGGDRIAEVPVSWAAPATALPVMLTPAEQADLLEGIDDPDTVLVVRTDDRGDFSRYTLRLSVAPDDASPPAGFDPLLASVEFSFKVECPSEFDCTVQDVCPPRRDAAPPIDYLVKDYHGFRRTMLERLALLCPGWSERNPADLGVTLVEVLAHVADELSYQQDAIATEAYLDTARSRVSLRRHARLVDYHIHEGCNARAWLRMSVDAPTVTLPAGTPVYTRVPRLPARIAPGSRDHAEALATAPTVFETVDVAVLHQDLDELAFYTWGEQTCCLARGATAATLRDDHPHLRVGDVLVLAETISPTTGEGADADPTRRWAVRLTEVRAASDPSGGLFQDPPTSDAVAVTEIAWGAADALPWPLCVTAGDGDLPTAVAWGNIVLADHGATLTDEPIGEVPAPHLQRVTVGGHWCDREEVDPVPPRFRPRLSVGPLTHALAAPPHVAFQVPLSAALLGELDGHTYGPQTQALVQDRGVALPAATTSVRGADPLWSLGAAGAGVRLRRGTDVTDSGTLYVTLEVGPASSALAAAPRDALPAVTLTSEVDGRPVRWSPRRDLLASSHDDRHVVAEAEHDGTVRLRFGDDEHGLRPDPGASFTATYRVGNGTAGNIGAGALAHAVTDVSAITGVTNPLPAAGGVDPESPHEIRRDAPEAFRIQERAVTGDDYVEVSERRDDVDRAAATMRWTGSWHTVFLTADRRGGAAVDAAFETGLRAHLERFRMAGYDVEVDGPRFVPLHIAVFVCVAEGHFRSAVGREVLAALGNTTLPDGRRGLFHPDGLTFGQPVYLSSIYAAAHAVPGVGSVRVDRFERQRDPTSTGLRTGVLAMDRLEIARLDGDPNFPERGVLELTLGGGT